MSTPPPPDTLLLDTTTMKHYSANPLRIDSEATATNTRSASAVHLTGVYHKNTDYTQTIV